MPIKKNKRTMQTEFFDGDVASQTPSASSVLEEDADAHTHLAAGQRESANMGLIMKELREFREDNSQQLNVIREEINKTSARIEEAEKRINETETRLQVAEDTVQELLHLQIHLDAKLTDLEELPATFELRVERAHRALMPKPPGDASPRSIVAKLSSHRMKEELLRSAWHKRGFEHLGKRVNLDHDYAPDVLKRRREYAEAKAVLKERKIRFQTPFPARFRVYYPEGAVVYESAGEATEDLA
uniref:L1 transposable element RRM domain-containing protein n=1 Tax=Hippocampus comes TaxID=109280 RepID=A0A3Q2Y3G7_HIPCM